MEHGFQLIERDGRRLAVLPLPDGVFVIKLTTRDGRHYVMCAQSLDAVICVAETLDEVLARYD